MTTIKFVNQKSGESFENEYQYNPLCYCQAADLCLSMNEDDDDWDWEEIIE